MFLETLLLLFFVIVVLHLLDFVKDIEYVYYLFTIGAIVIFITYIFLNPTLGLMPYNFLVSSLTDKKVFYTESEKLAIFPTSKILEENWKDIKKEYINICETVKDKNVGEIFIDEKEDFWKGWKTYPLLLFGNRYEENLNKCPVLNKIISSDPNILTAFFSIVEPGKVIPSHYGPYKGILRYHLGIKIPKDRTNCFISVDDQIYEWREGEGILFDESYKHFVMNSTGEYRVVLFLDVKSPLSFPLNLMNEMILLAIKHSPYRH